MSTKQGHTHIGRCTVGPLFTREDAEAALAELGFTFNTERFDYEKGDLRGRLSWRPDYCHPEDVEHGTEWFLTRPYHEGTIPILPREV
jgi:hypothetical protein